MTALVAGAPVVDVSDPHEAPYDVDVIFPRTQQRLALVLLGVFALSALLPLALVGSDSWSNAKEYLQIALPAEVGLLGSVLGFYFGSRPAAEE